MICQPDDGRIWIQCDVCGADMPSCASPDQAKIKAEEAGWKFLNGYDFCPDCQGMEVAPEYNAIRVQRQDDHLDWMPGAEHEDWLEVERWADSTKHLGALVGWGIYTDMFEVIKDGRVYTYFVLLAKGPNVTE